MYIPNPPQSLPEATASAAARVDFGHPTIRPSPELRLLLPRFFHVPQHTTPELRTRETPLQSQNITIGVIVGVLLAVFIGGTLYFCARYRRSIRFGDSRRPNRRRSGGGSSRGSKASSSGSSAPAPPPPRPPPAG